MHAMNLPAFEEAGDTAVDRLRAALAGPDLPDFGGLKADYDHATRREYAHQMLGGEAAFEYIKGSRAEIAQRMIEQSVKRTVPYYEPGYHPRGDLISKLLQHEVWREVYGDGFVS